MLILRMLSGMLAGAWGLLRHLVPGGRKKNRVAESPEPRPAPAVRAAATGSYARASREAPWNLTEAAWNLTVAPCPGAAREMGSEKNAERLGKAAEFHARAARKSVIDLDGEGVLRHMRHFRRYSSAPIKAAPPFSVGRGAGCCTGCGSTAARRDLAPATGACFACDPGRARSRPSWTARDGRRVPVEEMGDSHLADSVRMVRRWLLEAARPVSDDRVRMCGHVLEECDRRGIMGEVRNG